MHHTPRAPKHSITTLRTVIYWRLDDKSAYTYACRRTTNLAYPERNDDEKHFEEHPEDHIVGEQHR